MKTKPSQKQMSWEDAIRTVLTQAKAPMSYADIANEIRNVLIIKKFVLTICVLLLAVSVNAYEEFDTNGFSYVIYNDNDSGVTVWNCNKTGKIVVIPNSITHNGKKYSVTRIELFGSPNCSNIIIPNSVTSIGERAFAYCRNLTSIKIPNSVTSIGDYAFEGCSSLTSISFSNSVRSVGEDIFSGCNIQYAEFASIEGLCSINFKSSSSNPISYTHRLIINKKEIKDLIIPNSVTRIGNRAFNGCSGLTSVTIPNSVTSIGIEVFNGVGTYYSPCKLIVGSQFYKTMFGNKVRNPFGDNYYYAFSGGKFTLPIVDDEITKVVDATQIPTSNSIIGVYDLNGRRIDAPQKGINIIRYQDGTTKKVIMK